MSREIPLSRGMVAIVDDDDFESLSSYTWHVSKQRDGATRYAVRTVSGIRHNGVRDPGLVVLMHRQLLGITNPLIEVDHRNHNGLDNRRYNLRIANASKNRANMIKRKPRTSKYKGVSWCSDREKWRAVITVRDRHVFLGRFECEEDAAAAYNLAAEAMFGEFANQNILEGRTVFDADAIKYACSGKWQEILSRIGGVSLEVLDGKHHPCVKCGGKDRFRMIDKEDGALFCSQCFNKGNGDGIAAVMWLTGLTFPEACERLAAEVGLTVKSKEINVIEEMAWRKNINADSLRAFGAAIAMRGELKVCRVPMYDADMQRVGNFDMSPVSPDFDKGKAEAGCRLGLFIATKPAAGDHVLLVEGVKDAAALGFTNKIAVGLPTCRMDAAFARMFRDCHVTIIPDRDKAGLEGASETAARLYGVAASVKIAELPAEYKESGGADVRDVLRQRDGQAKIIAAIEHAKSWLPEGKQKPRFVSLGDAVVDFVKKIKQKQNLITTGLPEVDYALGGGILQGEMVIIAGRPSHGKTMVGLQAIDHMAKQFPVLLISEEMPVAALCERSVCALTELPKEAWGDNERSILDIVGPHYTVRSEIKIVESCMTVDAAIDAILTSKQEFGIGAVCVDYVQRLRGKGNTEYEWVSDASARLKQVAMQQSLVFIALCQLNRGVEQRTTSSPRMSDLRASGQLEQDADVIIFVEYLCRTDPQKHGPEDYRILVAKNRNRGTKKTVIECVFKPDRQTIYPIERHIEDHRNYRPEFASELF